MIAVVAISRKASTAEELIHKSREENGFLDEFYPSMMDSSEEASYEDDDDGEENRRKNRFTRYDSEDVILHCYSKLLCWHDFEWQGAI